MQFKPKRSNITQLTNRPPKTIGKIQQILQGPWIYISFAYLDIDYFLSRNHTKLTE